MHERSNLMTRIALQVAQVMYKILKKTLSYEGGGEMMREECFSLSLDNRDLISIYTIKLSWAI